MSDSILISGHGYAYGNGSGAITKVGESATLPSTMVHVSDPTIDHLWNDYRNLIGRKPPASLTFAVVARVAQLLGNFEEWLWLQYRNNPYLYSYGLDFIEDCLRFAETGKREMMLSTWYELLDERPTATHVDLSGRPDKLNGFVIPDTESLLSKWCTQPDGINDLIFTAHILFGEVK